MIKPLPPTGSTHLLPPSSGKQPTQMRHVVCLKRYEMVQHTNNLHGGNVRQGGRSRRSSDFLPCGGERVNGRLPTIVADLSDAESAFVSWIVHFRYSRPCSSLSNQPLPVPSFLLRQQCGSLRPLVASKIFSSSSWALAAPHGGVPWSSISLRVMRANTAAFARSQLRAARSAGGRTALVISVGTSQSRDPPTRRPCSTESTRFPVWGWRGHKGPRIAWISTVEEGSGRIGTPHSIGPHDSACRQVVVVNNRWKEEHSNRVGRRTSARSAGG